MLKYATRKAIKYFNFKCARLQLKVVKNAHQIALLKLCLMPCEYWLFVFEIVQESRVCLREQRYNKLYSWKRLKIFMFPTPLKMFRVADYPAHQQSKKDTHRSVLFALLIILTDNASPLEMRSILIGDALYALSWPVGTS